MEVAPLGHGADLDARDDLDADAPRRRVGLGDAGDRVVIGDADDGQARGVRGAHELGRREAAVGGGGVKVEIDHE